MGLFLLKEIKNGEGRFFATPSHVFEYAKADANIYVEEGGGVKSGFPDGLYHEYGAGIRNREEMAERALVSYEALILKVKEILPVEFNFITPKSKIISFGHLASNRNLTEIVIEREGTYLSLEDIVEDGKRPVLAKMSEIAGEEAVRIGMKFFSATKPYVIIVGYGNVGKAAHRFLKNNFKVPWITALDANPNIIGENNSEQRFNIICTDNPAGINELLNFMIRAARIKYTAFLIILAPYSPENKAPIVVTKNTSHIITEGSVIVDVSIDQGGACEFSQVTTHENPVVELECGIKYIGIPNLPGGVPKRSTPVFSESVFPYMMQIVKLGFTKALKENSALKNAVSIYEGKVTSNGLAQTFGFQHTPIEKLL